MKVVSVYVDGGCAGNGTEDSKGYGSFCAVAGTNKRLETFDLPAKTNNEAEYQSLLKAMKYADDVIQRNPKLELKFEFLMDSNLVINQVSGTWRVKADNLRAMHVQASEWLTAHNAKILKVSRDIMVKAVGH